jgi:uncharacterized membrane protein YfcA
VFEVILVLVSIFGGGIATIADFGIGSFIIPLLSLKTGTGAAIIGVSIAHFLGTGFHFYTWREHVNRKVLLGFGLPSAAGGIIGAFLNSAIYNSILTIIFGSLLIFAGIMGLTGLTERLRFTGKVGWISGALSGLLGGLVGNQGGIRSASMLGFGLTAKEYIATAAGIALLVDIARIPIYVVLQSNEIIAIWQYIVFATIGVFIGTFLGGWLLRKIPEKVFRIGVSLIIYLVGIFELTRH